MLKFPLSTWTGSRGNNTVSEKQGRNKGGKAQKRCHSGGRTGAGEGVGATTGDGSKREPSGQLGKHMSSRGGNGEPGRGQV